MNPNIKVLRHLGIAMGTTRYGFVITKLGPAKNLI